MRPNSNRSNKSYDYKTQEEKPSILASYGKNSMLEQQGSFVDNKNFNQKMRSNSNGYDKINQFSVYQRQQKPYNIIGNYPRSTSTELKKYPKLSL